MRNEDHIAHLRYEIEVLRSRIKEYDTGHLHTAIDVLSKRVEELEIQTKTVLDSSYPDGDGYWNTTH
jgi:hypothetical protein